MSVAEELDKLKKMRDDGTITEEQYDRAVSELEEARARARKRDRDDEEEDEVREERRPRRRSSRDDYDDEHEELSPRQLERKGREWGMFLHLSLFAGHVVPFGGIILPIIIWQTKKDELPKLDRHGMNAVNWLISSFIYAIISGLLCLVIVGIPLVIALIVMNIVFPIIAAIKANEGRVWKYPLAIPFFT